MSESKNKAYSEMGIEPWDVIIDNFNPSAVRGYFIGEALAYLMRYDGAGAFADRCGTKDLKKAKHFIERLIEYDESKKIGSVRTSLSIPVASSGGSGASGGSGMGGVGGGGAAKMLSIYRVWPDKTTQEATEAAHLWKSDDFMLIAAASEQHALDIAKAKGFV